jgi:hypothetical protein
VIFAIFTVAMSIATTDSTTLFPKVNGTAEAAKILYKRAKIVQTF